MTITQYEFWFDNQQRRFLEQIIKAFSGIYWQPGMRQGVQQPPRLVPCRMATSDEVVGYIMRNMSENALNAVPLITVTQTGLRGLRDRVQDLNLVEQIQVNERQVINNQYTNQPGNAYTVHRIMPRPFEMSFQVDIWTSNNLQKHQIIEQLLPIVYPYFDIQNSENGIDWTALSTVYIDDDFTYTSRSIPIGTNIGALEVFTLTGKMPFWLSPPAKVTSQTLIKEVITNIYSGSTTDECGILGGQLVRRVITTPEDAQIQVDGDVITLLNEKSGLHDAEGNLLNFQEYLGQFGTFQNGISVIQVSSIFGGPYISGTITLDNNNVNKVFWQIDPSTLPANTLPAISDVIDPMRSFYLPGDPNSTLPVPNANTRYLILNDIGPSMGWPGLNARKNDIIQYNNNGWYVAFDSNMTKTQQYVVNTASANQLKWDGTQWTYAIDSLYAPGFWQIIVNQVGNPTSQWQINVTEIGNGSDQITGGWSETISESGNSDDATD